MKRAAQNGFTLMELMATLAIIGVLATIAIPDMSSFMRKNRLASVSNDLLHSLQLARTEAIKRQANVVVCASDNPGAADDALACSGGKFSGWFVFVDTNLNWVHDAGEPVLEKHASVDSSVLVANDKDGVVNYGSSGFAEPPGVKTPTGNILICDHLHNPLQGTIPTARALLITATGRARVSHDASDVSTAQGATGGTCPP